MKRYSVIFFTFVFVFVFVGCIDLSTQGENQAKIAKLEAKVDSLQNIINGKKNNFKSKKTTAKIVSKNNTKSTFNKSSMSIKSITDDVEEYLKSFEYAKAYKRRGKDISAKEFYEKAEKYKRKVSKLFAKDAVVTLDFSMKHNITQNFMFKEKNWKLRAYYYTSVNQGKKPKNWLTSDKEANRLENLVPNHKYRVKFKVLEGIDMPYGGTMSYFAMHVKYLSIRPIE